MLKIYYQNVRGLRTKTQSFFRNMYHVNHDLIILTETWLNNNVLSGELFGNKYLVYRRDRETSKLTNKKDGGGVLIAVSPKLNPRRMEQWESECEDLWITVDISIDGTSTRLAICAVYLPPPVNKKSLDLFTANCNAVSEMHNMYTCIAGDFNMGNIAWSTSTPSCAQSLGQSLIDFASINNLQQ